MGKYHRDQRDDIEHHYRNHPDFQVMSLIPPSLDTRPVRATLLKVTKLEAARSQIETAIELWFNGGDDISILALAAASHEVIHRLYRNKGMKDLLFDSTLLTPEQKHEFPIMLKAAANCFKHAKNETEATDSITFTPEISVVFLTSSICGMWRFGVTLNDTESAFTIWHQLHRPHWFKDVPTSGIPAEVLNQLRNIPPREFFQSVLLLRAAAAARANGKK